MGHLESHQRRRCQERHIKLWFFIELFSQLRLQPRFLKMRPVELVISYLARWREPLRKKKCIKFWIYEVWVQEEPEMEDTYCKRGISICVWSLPLGAWIHPWESETVAATGRTSRRGEIQWAPTNTHLQRYTSAATGMVQGLIRYATTRISSLVESYNLYITNDIPKLITDHTNIPDWRNIDSTELQAYVGLLLLAEVYWLRNASIRSLWNNHPGTSSRLPWVKTHSD